MSDDALEILFNRIINCDDRQLIADAIQHFAERELLFPRLTNALESDRLPLDKVLSIMNIVSGIKSAAARDVIDTYFDLLDYYQWIPPTQRMMESLARMMAKHHEVQVSYRNLWKLFDSCHELQIEGAARVSISQLVLQYAEEEDLTVVVDGIAAHFVGRSPGAIACKKRSTPGGVILRKSARCRICSGCKENSIRSATSSHRNTF